MQNISGVKTKSKVKGEHIMKMKAAVCRAYGALMTIEEVELAPPKEHEVLVKTNLRGGAKAITSWFREESI
jgi:predicted transglutaminase-like protease